MKNIFFCALIPILLLSACVKEYRGVEVPSFDVQVDSLTYGVNKPITFRVTGYADRVTFYSGDVGRNYDNKDRISVTGIPQLKFTSFRQYGVQDLALDTTIQLYISTDFSNAPNIPAIEKATWINITERAQFSKVLFPNTAYTSSGIINLSEFARVDTPLYVAFKYQGLKAASSQRTWTIKELYVDNVLEDGSVVNVANLTNINWGVVNILGAPTWSFNTTQLTISGGAAQTPDNLDWIVSQPIYLNRVKRDAGVSIRSNVKSLLTDYTFAGYPKPGTYTAVFEAYNATQWDNKQTLKKIILTIK